MRAWKAIALILTLCLLLFACYGCVEEVSVTAYTDKNGGVHREYSVSYDAKGVDAETVKSQIVTVMERFVESRNIKEYSTVDAESDGLVTLKVVFPSQEDYKALSGYTGREANKSNSPSKTGFFNAYDTKIESYLTAENIREIRSFMDEEFQELPITAEFYYSYGTTNRTTVSNGERSEKDGIYYHTWKLDPDEESEMMVRIYALNLFAMYGVALLIFVLSLTIVFVIIRYNRKKESKRAALTRGNPVLFEESTLQADEKEKE